VGLSLDRDNNTENRARSARPDNKQAITTKAIAAVKERRRAYVLQD
jgi:hypothetical protein